HVLRSSVAGSRCGDRRWPDTVPWGAGRRLRSLRRWSIPTPCRRDSSPFSSSTGTGVTRGLFVAGGGGPVNLLPFRMTASGTHYESATCDVQRRAQQQRFENVCERMVVRRRHKRYDFLRKF